jgi:hypothetical protein
MGSEMMKARKRDTRCIDCGYQTQPRKPKGNYEQYIVRERIWRAAGMPAGKYVNAETLELKGGDGCLCVACIERRLRRKLRLSDFNPRTVWVLLRNYCDGWQTPRLSEAVFRFRAAMNAPWGKGRERLVRMAYSGHFLGGRTFYIAEDKTGERRAGDLVVLQAARRRRTPHRCGKSRATA